MVPCQRYSLGLYFRPDGSVGMALVLPALTDCRWWFESLLVHSGVSSATRQKAPGADHKKGQGSQALMMLEQTSASLQRTEF